MLGLPRPRQATMLELRGGRPGKLLALPTREGWRLGSQRVLRSAAHHQRLPPNIAAPLPLLANSTPQICTPFGANNNYPRLGGLIALHRGTSNRTPVPQGLLKDRPDQPPTHFLGIAVLCESSGKSEILKRLSRSGLRLQCQLEKRFKKLYVHLVQRHD